MCENSPNMGQRVDACTTIGRVRALCTLSLPTRNCCRDDLTCLVLTPSKVETSNADRGMMSPLGGTACCREHSTVVEPYMVTPLRGGSRSSVDSALGRGVDQQLMHGIPVY